MIYVYENKLYQVYRTHVHSNEGWANVQARGLGMWNPFLVDADQPFHAVDKLCSIEGG